MLVDGVQVHYFPTGLGRRLFRSPAMGRALDRDIASFDVVHIHYVWVWPTTRAARAARRHGVPYVLAPRGMLVPSLIAGKSRLVKTAWIALFERSNVNHAAAIHVTADVEADYLAPLGFTPKRVEIIGNGVDDIGHPPHEEAAEPYALYLGRLSWEKGLDRLIPAMAHAPGMRLLIAGEGEPAYCAKLEELAATHGVADRIAFLGHADDTRKWALIGGASFLVLPSYSENFGVAVAEAMSAGCPVIVASEVGLANIVGQTGSGLVVDARPPTLGAAMLQLAGDAALRRRMGEAARQCAKDQFQWSAIAARADHLYRVIREGSSRRDKP